jgi:hypothetical protein
MNLTDKLFALILLGWTNASAGNGPFGLERGMSKDQVIRLVGLNNVADRYAGGKYSGSDLLILSSVPKPHGAFVTYALTISPKDGLLRNNRRGSRDFHQWFREERTGDVCKHPRCRCCQLREARKQF